MVPCVDGTKVSRMNRNLSPDEFREWVVPSSYGGTWSEVSDHMVNAYRGEPYWTDLAGSVAEEGVREPIDVLRSGDMFVVSDGHHRATAALLAGKSVPYRVEN